MDPANWIFLQVLIFPSLSLTRFISLWIFTLCCLLFIWNLFIVWFTFIVSTTNKQTNNNNSKKFAQLWYKFLMISNSLFFHHFVWTIPAEKSKENYHFHWDVTWTSFWISILFMLFMYFTYIFPWLSVIFTYLILCFFWNVLLAFYLGKQKYKKNVVIFIMPFENICIMPSFFCFCFFYSILEMLQQFYIFFALFLPFIIEIWLNYLWYKIIRM